MTVAHDYKRKKPAITSAHLFVKKLDRAHTETKENPTTIEIDKRPRLKSKKSTRWQKLTAKLRDDPCGHDDFSPVTSSPMWWRALFVRALSFLFLERIPSLALVGRWV